MSEPTEGVRLVIDNAAEPEPGEAASEPAPGTGRSGAAQERNASGLPEECHIVALGTEGKVRWYLDAAGQLCGLEAKEHTRTNILGMLGRHANDAEKIWPRHNAKGAVNGWDADGAARALFTASSRRLWSPRDHVRGRGFWPDADGGLIVHAGTRLWQRGRFGAAGIIHGSHVYPSAEALMMPVLPADPRDPFAAGRAALALFAQWRWSRKVDPRLALGIWACLVAGGALSWRPIIAVNGPPDAGKSRLFEWLNAIGGGWALLTQDASEAGLRQSLRYDALGLLVDEAEPGADGRTAAIERMGRRATGGGRSRRGTSSDQTAIDFTLRSTLALGAIRRNSYLVQDVSRRVVLELQQPQHDLPLLDEARAREIGGQLLHLLIDGWPRLVPAIDEFRRALLDCGHKPRQALVIGTVLGAAEILLGDQPVIRDLAEDLVDELRPDALPDARLVLADEEEWLQRLAALSLPLDPSPGIERRSTAEWLALALRLDRFDTFRETAERVLAQHGLVIHRPKDKSPPSDFWLPARNPMLERLHHGSKWAAQDGLGRWTQAAQQLPGAQGASGRLPGGRSVWGTRIPLALILDPEAAEAVAAKVRSNSLVGEFERDGR